MDNRKTDSYYLKRIVADLSFIVGHTEGLSYHELCNNEILLDSMMFRMIQISENSDKLTSGFKEKNSAIHWRALKAMRNHIVHEYGNVDLSIVYETVTRDIPAFLQTISGTLGEQE